jgi:hypothetical protein
VLVLSLCACAKDEEKNVQEAINIFGQNDEIKEEIVQSTTETEKQSESDTQIQRDEDNFSKVTVQESTQNTVDDNSNHNDEDAADAYQKVLSGELGPEGKIIQEQTFEVNLSGLGNVIFASYEPEITQSPLPDVSFYILDEYGNVIEQLEGSNEDNLRSATDSFCDVNAISFLDINGDGCKDIITICSYEYIQGPDVGNGFMEVRIYCGAEDGSFHYKKEMSEDATSALVEPSINAVLGFLGVKK